MEDKKMMSKVIQQVHREQRPPCGSCVIPCALLPLPRSPLASSLDGFGPSCPQHRHFTGKAKTKITNFCQSTIFVFTRTPLTRRELETCKDSRPLDPKSTQIAETRAWV